ARPRQRREGERKAMLPAVALNNLLRRRASHAMTAIQPGCPGLADRGQAFRRRIVHRSREVRALAYARQPLPDPALGRTERRHIMRHVERAGVIWRGMRPRAIGDERTPAHMAGNEPPPLRLDIG